MTDDSDHKASVPAPALADGEEADTVELIADAAVSERRSAKRKLRIPDDPVPRNSAQALSGDPAHRATIPDTGTGRATTPDPIPADGAPSPAADGAERRTEPDPIPVSVPPPVAVAEAERPVQPTTAATSVARPALGVPHVPRLAGRPASIPPPPRPAPPEPGGRARVSVPAPRPTSQPPTRPASNSPDPRTERSGGDAHGEVEDATATRMAPVDLGVVVRQVRRKVQSVGTGVRPTPSNPPLSSAATASADSGPRRTGIPLPGVAVGHVADGFDVPPVDALAATATGSRALRTPGLPSISVPGDEDSVDIEVETETETDEDLAADVSDEVQIDDEAATAGADESADEITISDDAVTVEVDDAAAARPIAGRKPPAPPPAPKRPKSGGRPAPPPRRRKRPWWEDLFNDDYIRTAPRYTPEQCRSDGDFIESSLGVEKGATVLDIACGDGRQAIEMAARGYEVIALDLSLPMLSRAADAAQDRDVKLNFLHSDMLAMEFSEMFDAAYCTNTSFGFFDDARNTDVIHRIYRALKVGGTFLLDVVNRDYALQSQPAMTWFEVDGCVCMEETSFDYISSRLLVKRTMILGDGRQKEVEGSIRLYSLHELGHILHDAGFRIIEVSGSYRTAGAYFGANSSRLVILAQKQRHASDPAVTIPDTGAGSRPPAQPVAEAASTVGPSETTSADEEKRAGA